MRRIAESGRRLVAIAATGVVALAALASPAQAQSAGTNRSNAVVVSNPDLARALGGGIGTLARGDGPYVVYISGVRVELSFAEQWLDRGGVWEFGSSKLTMQWDGNLVVYNRNTGAVKWSPNIFGRGGVQMVFQYDANLVVYTSNRSVVWASNKFCDSPNDLALIGLQGDGNFVVYCGFVAGGEAYVYAIWATGTNHP